jgi:hypothetical protein
MRDGSCVPQAPEQGPGGVTAIAAIAKLEAQKNTLKNIIVVKDLSEDVKVLNYTLYLYTSTEGIIGIPNQVFQ